MKPQLGRRAASGGGWWAAGSGQRAPAAGGAHSSARRRQMAGGGAAGWAASGRRQEAGSLSGMGGRQGCGATGRAALAGWRRRTRCGHGSRYRTRYDESVRCLHRLIIPGLHRLVVAATPGVAATKLAPTRVGAAWLSMFILEGNTAAVVTNVLRLPPRRVMGRRKVVPAAPRPQSLWEAPHDANTPRRRAAAAPLLSDAVPWTNPVRAPYFILWPWPVRRGGF
ncbi:hypothetical protein GGX14DRAFT_387700 [Mycena pura]|uniref:Uncharacterized protein n=1 Tax=Mycena pura TaxID=153505 RepID=A0AAD6YM50_9AGAR|nr:hypothetical protein GGX14DRAFT_387700 [Mycena pura]